MKQGARNLQHWTQQFGNKHLRISLIPFQPLSQDPSFRSSLSLKTSSQQQPPPRMSRREREEGRDEAEKEARFAQALALWKEKSRRKDAARTGPVRFRTGFRNTILDVMRERGWKETDSETEWDIFWVGKDWIRAVYDKVHLDVGQRVNHFRNYYEIARKDLLLKNLQRARRIASKKGHESEYDFFPQTFQLPGDYLRFVEAFRRQPDLQWIMKPIGRAQGKGIFLFDRLHQIDAWKTDNRWKPDNPQAERYIAQQYISSPLLVGGKKFDLRIYCLVTSYAPLTAYLYREGFARFTSSRYSLSKGNLADTYVHLTNVAVQKQGPQYDASSGGKMDLRSLKLYVGTRFGRGRANKLFGDIEKVVVRTLLAGSKVIISDRQSFELYGFDVMIDADLKPWLIEVNACPSLSANTEDDYALKMRLLHDTLNIVDMEQRLTGEEEQVGGFDLIFKGGYVRLDPAALNTSHLGCNNNRKRQLAKLARAASKRPQAHTRDERG